MESELLPVISGKEFKFYLICNRQLRKNPWIWNFIINKNKAIHWLKKRGNDKIFVVMELIETGDLRISRVKIQCKNSVVGLLIRYKELEILSILKIPQKTLVTYYISDPANTGTLFLLSLSLGLCLFMFSS